MKISELIAHQRDWEQDLGLTRLNQGDHSAARTQEELDEYREEADPLKKLMEAVDVLIVIAGGMGQLAEELGISYEKVDELLLEKLETNQRKYDPEVFRSHPLTTAISRSRFYWDHPDQFDGNDYY